MNGDLTTAHSSQPGAIMRMGLGSDPHAAAGQAMVLMARHPEFGDLSFRQMASLIIGQVNRKHYRFVLRGGAPVGFVGWALCSEAAGRRWLLHNDASAVGDGRQGDCVVLNHWLADGPEMNAFIIAQMLQILPAQRLLFARRRYADGRTRPVVLRRPRSAVPDQDSP